MRWVNHIRDHCDAPPEVKALLLVLATYSDADGRCWPSLDRLAANLGIHPDSAKRRRNRAVSSGWLVIETPGRWKGASTHYQLQPKGGASAPLRRAERGASVPAKGVHGRRSKGGVDAPRTIKKFQEGADGAPSMERRSSPIEDKARRISSAIATIQGPTVFEPSMRAAWKELRDYGLPTVEAASSWLNDFERGEAA